MLPRSHILAMRRLTHYPRETATSRRTARILAGESSIVIGPKSAGRSVAKFPTTHWSCVVAAGGAAAPEARRALEELCAVYWYPLYAFIRRQGHDPGTAEDLVQGFFTTLLERDSLSSIDRARGDFRSFLMAACTHYLANGARAASGP